jgi:hypothetical protein
MDGLGYISEAVKRSYEGHGPPCYAVMISCNAYDTYARHRGEIFDCKTKASLGSPTEGMDLDPQRTSKGSSYSTPSSLPKIEYYTFLKRIPDSF